MVTLLMKFASCHNPAPKILKRYIHFLKTFVRTHCTPSRKHSNYVICIYTLYIYIYIYILCVCVTQQLSNKNKHF